MSEYIDYNLQGDTQGYPQGYPQMYPQGYPQAYPPVYPQEQQIIIETPSSGGSFNALSITLIIVKILIFLLILGVIAGIIYGMYMLYKYIKDFLGSTFGTRSVELGGVCTTHNDCIGWVPATAGTPGCCTANGKSAGLGVKGTCMNLVSGALGAGYCPNESPW